MKEISIENVIKNIQFAERYEASKLRKACIAFIVRNMDKSLQAQNTKELDNQTIHEIQKILIFVWNFKIIFLYCFLFTKKCIFKTSKYEEPF